MPANPALDDKAADGGSDGADAEADTNKQRGASLLLALTIPERVPETKVSFALDRFTAGRGSSIVQLLRTVFRSLERGETLVFAVNDVMHGASISFSLPAEAFLAGTTEGPSDVASLAPEYFVYTLDGSAPVTRDMADVAVGLDQRLFSGVLAALSGDNFSSLEGELWRAMGEIYSSFRSSHQDMDAFRRSLQHDLTAYRVLAGAFYVMVAGTFSDAAFATMNAGRMMGSFGWTIFQRFADIQAFAQQKNVIRANAPLILTTATVASLAGVLDAPEELIQAILSLCGG